MKNKVKENGVRGDRLVDMDLCEKIATKIVEDLSTIEKEIPLADFRVIMYNMFIHSIDVLTDNGWTQQELIYDINEFLETSPFRTLN